MNIIVGDDRCFLGGLFGPLISAPANDLIWICQKGISSLSPYDLCHPSSCLLSGPCISVSPPTVPGVSVFAACLAVPVSVPCIIRPPDCSLCVIIIIRFLSPLSPVTTGHRRWRQHIVWSGRAQWGGHWGCGDPVPWRGERRGSPERTPDEETPKPQLPHRHPLYTTGGESSSLCGPHHHHRHHHLRHLTFSSIPSSYDLHPSVCTFLSSPVSFSAPPYCLLVLILTPFMICSSIHLPFSIFVCFLQRSQSFILSSN